MTKEGNLKIRRDALVVSSILFTIALLMLAPLMWGNAVTLLQSGPYASDPESYRGFDYFAPMSFASLTLIVIGLIVTWFGYFKGVRWTWFVMFVILWAWAFPDLMMPYLHRWSQVDLNYTLAAAIRGNTIARSFVEVALEILLMVLALALPLRTFFPGRGGGSGESGHPNSGAPYKPTLSEKRQGRRDLKIRRDAVAVSSILFTLALLILTPAMCRAAANVRESCIWGAVGPFLWVQNCFALAGIASLAVIVTGLIVAWAGYIRGVRWTWFVMFVIVWVWAFPVLLLPFLLPWRGVETMAQSFAGAVSQSGTERSYAEVVLAFLLMVLALALPLRTFLLAKSADKHDAFQY
jgi:hypothetical protein